MNQSNLKHSWCSVALDLYRTYSVVATSPWSRGWQRGAYLLSVTGCDMAVLVGDDSEDIRSLDRMLSDIYFANFSLFQSMPDSWAIDQLFPVMPIHRLNEEPTRHAVLGDITCDSDGKVEGFIGCGKRQRTLMLHPCKAKDPYLLAVFLVGRIGNTRRST